MEDIRKTCLYDEHVKLGAKIEEFAGFLMPIVYTSIKEEHNAVREHVGMFDVSHMGEFVVRGKEATEYVDNIFTNSIVDKENGTVTYGMMLYPNGTIVDDLLVYKVNHEEYFFVVNASNIAKDYEWVVEQTGDFDVTVSNLSDEYSEIAIQGPEAEERVKALLGLDLGDLPFFNFRNAEYKNHQLLISRTGYTGEDGFEIYASKEAIEEIWQVFIAGDVVPCGLGSRDTLRFEAALPLYGHEISDEITPLEAGLKFFTKIDSENQFIGKPALLEQQEKGLERRVVGIELTKLAIPRAGYLVYSKDQEIGYVTTGYLSVTLDKPIAMAMLKKEFTKKDTEIEVKIRNKSVPGFVRDKKFLKKNYKTKGA
ncbi:MAG TPA: glycine cleavage system aminomethyltransferase GcvT, partial [Bacillota bacterium]|nr:glycine cleavage system aminomethyltransferase GcvT [Bacillota bacterium]